MRLPFEGAEPVLVEGGGWRVTLGPAATTNMRSLPCKHAGYARKAERGRTRASCTCLWTGGDRVAAGSYGVRAMGNAGKPIPYCW